MPLIPTPIARRPAPAALLADLDGTLVDSPLDLDALKREIGAHGTTILEHLAALPAVAAAHGWEIVHAHEARAAEHAVWAPGAQRLVSRCATLGIPLALVTNNAAAIVRPVLDRLGLACATLVTREDAPPKPSPDPLLLALDRLAVPAQRAVFLGDAELDVRAGEAAGVFTVHVGPRCAGLCRAHAATLDDAWPLLGV